MNSTIQTVWFQEFFQQQQQKKWQVTAEKKSNVMWKRKEKFNLSPELDN